MKKFFGIEGRYKFERMDLSAFFMVVMVIAIIVWNKGAYIGLPVAIIGLIWDLKDGCHINCVVLRLATIVVNIYFLTL